MPDGSVADWLIAVFTGVSALVLGARALRRPMLDGGAWQVTQIGSSRKLAVEFEIVDVRGIPAQLVRIEPRVRWSPDETAEESGFRFPNTVVTSNRSYRARVEVIRPSDTGHGYDYGHLEVRVFYRWLKWLKPVSQTFHACLTIKPAGRDVYTVTIQRDTTPYPGRTAPASW